MKKGDQTRERILAQAAPVFNTHGYEGATLSQLMQATGLEKGGIYRHFRNKEDLAAESFKYAWSEVLQARLAGLDQVPTSLGKLRHILDNFIEVRSPIPGGCPLLNTASDSDDGNPVLRDLAEKTLRGWKMRLMGILEGGIAAGEIQPLVSPKTTANVMIATLEGAVMMTRLEGNYDALKDARTALIAYLDSIAVKG
ncbi:TetR/AcrR family transcriptional regulator [Terriglobus tenax]|uniref:TetR/AcrR family transcriptional regulator n=1 Tax=Terriglobus tenax TaxID=1111115 RepID=UPI0021E0DB9F|nr:TetR/AcrR family transcriptional regulator [Terriglobus tenax]